MRNSRKKNSRDYWTNEGLIAWDFEDYINLLQDLQKLKSQPDLVCDVATVANNLPTLYSYWNFVPKNIFETVESQRVQEIFNSFAQIKSDEFRKTNSNTLITKYMIMNGVFKLNIDEEIFLKIAERYFIIKVERNDIANARMITKKTATDSENDHAVFLKEFMKQGLVEYSVACNAMKKI